MILATFSDFPLSLAQQQQMSGIHLLMESLRTGGLTMMLIVVCSFAAVTVSIMTWLRLRPQGIIPKKVKEALATLPALAERGDISSLQQLLAREPAHEGAQPGIALGRNFARLLVTIPVTLENSRKILSTSLRPL